MSAAVPHTAAEMAGYVAAVVGLEGHLCLAWHQVGASAVGLVLQGLAVAAVAAGKHNLVDWFVTAGRMTAGWLVAVTAGQVAARLQG